MTEIDPFMVHIADQEPNRDHLSLCGKPLKPYKVGNGQVCQECEAKWKNTRT